MASKLRRNSRAPARPGNASLKRLHPKLRLILRTRGDRALGRAQQSSLLFVDESAIRSGRRPTRSDLLINVYITLRRGAATPRTRRKLRREGRLASGTVSLKEIEQLNGKDTRRNILFIEPAEPIRRPPRPPRPLVADQALLDDNPPPKRAIDLDRVPASIMPSALKRSIQWELQKKKRVLVGIIDVQGFDFGHCDFLRNEVKTRFVRIWDQGGRLRPHPKRFPYGSEISSKHMNDALEEQKKKRTAAALLECQSWTTPGSHGTHVASIAAGNHGVCPSADIAAVLVALTPEEMRDRSRSFYDSTRVADAVKYLVELADERNQPVSINISLGTNGDAHDGSGPLCQWLDSVLALPGRCISVAAGNAGQEKALRSDDFGWVMGRIHTSGRIPARGLDCDIDWVIVGDTIRDVSENELEIWYSAQDRFAVSILPPHASQFFGPIGPREFIENKKLPGGMSISIYNEIHAPGNGANYLALYLSPPRDSGGEVRGGITAGVWTVRLHGRDIRDGRFDGWIERDDPSAELASKGPAGQLWRFPSFFSERSNVDNRSINSLGCAPRVIGVANYDDVGGMINITSSQGPTRDGRSKPEVAAPGTDILAANGFPSGIDDKKWIRMTGTSMASPYVAGVAAQMLAVQPRLTAAQIIGILQRTARPLPGRSYDWTDDSGYGVISPEACIAEAGRAGFRVEIKRRRAR